MYILYDNLTATLVAGTILAILFAMQLRITNVNVQQTGTYMTKKQSLDFADWLEDDLLKIGRNMDEDEQAFENPVTSGERTTKFIFYRDTLVNVSGDPSSPDYQVFGVATRYQLAYVDTRTDGNASVDVYQAHRAQKLWNRETSSFAATAWTPDGRSAPLLHDFQIRMLNKDGDAVSNPASIAQANPDSIQQTQAKFSMLPPFQDGEGSLRAMHWGANLLFRY